MHPGQTHHHPCQRAAILQLDRSQGPHLVQIPRGPAELPTLNLQASLVVSSQAPQRGKVAFQALKPFQSWVRVQDWISNPGRECPM